MLAWLKELGCKTIKYTWVSCKKVFILLVLTPPFLHHDLGLIAYEFEVSIIDSSPQFSSRWGRLYLLPTCIGVNGLPVLSPLALLIYL